MGISIPARKFKPLILSAIAGLIVMQVVALMPNQVDQSTGVRNLDPKEILEANKPQVILARGIPNKIPEYSVDKFKFASVQNGQKQWNIIARTADVFNKERIVHARDITAYLYDSSDKVTVVTGREAKYFMEDRNLEVFGDVVTKMPDGFETKSQYMRYLPKEKYIQIPDVEPVSGMGKQKKGEVLSFTALGLDFKMGSNEITLPKQVVFIMHKTEKDPATGLEKNRDTKIESDHCVIERSETLAHFTMQEDRPLDSRFVLITETDFYSRGRRADVNYGDNTNLVNYMNVYDDVLIKERGKPTLRYGTGGQADFDSKRNLITLRKYPQVYQDNDTVTGDIIIMHRDSDVVEAEHSNAFSEGEKKNGKEEPSSKSSGSPKSVQGQDGSPRGKL